MHFSKKAYKTPQTKVVEVSIHGMLCQSGPYGENTEKFTVGSNNYGDDDFE